LEEEWPAPKKYRDRRGYEWQAPELALLASLVGSFGTLEIAQILTERLRRITGDPEALRKPMAVQLTTNRIGLQTKDVVGGITTSEAGKEIGSLTIINQAIAKGDLKGMRVGRRWVIPHADWAAWKAKRIFPPEGFIPLRSLKEPLSIRSDKLSEFARLGYVPSAVRCNPYGTKGPSTQFGTWFIDPVVAERLIADRHAGRPMPWHGKPLEDNLRITFKLWQSRQHPSGCKTCAEIWGKGDAPNQFEDYAKRYPPLAHGAKRHLTMPWSPGLTLDEVARKAGCDRAHCNWHAGCHQAWPGKIYHENRRDTLDRSKMSGRGAGGVLDLASHRGEALFVQHQAAEAIHCCEKAQDQDRHSGRTARHSVCREGPVLSVAPIDRIFRAGGCPPGRRYRGAAPRTA
jgi:hypothetical protein